MTHYGSLNSIHLQDDSSLDSSPSLSSTSTRNSIDLRQLQAEALRESRPTRSLTPNSIDLRQMLADIRRDNPDLVQPRRLFENAELVVSQANTASASEDSIAELKKENEESTRLNHQFSRACGFCLTEVPRRRVVFAACGHAVCRACAEQIKAGAARLSCPICRTKSGVVPLFEHVIEAPLTRNTETQTETMVEPKPKGIFTRIVSCARKFFK